MAKKKSKSDSFLKYNQSWSGTMDTVYDRHVLTLVENDERKDYDDFGHHMPLGIDFVTIRRHVVKHGRADFSKTIRLADKRRFTPQERVLLYCYANMRPHFWSAYSNFRLNRPKYESVMNQRVAVIIDFGCGPGTAGLAWAELNPKRRFGYFGIDSAPAMRSKCVELLEGVTKARSNQKKSVIHMYPSWARLPKEFQSKYAIILNFSFFFASESLNATILKELASKIAAIHANSPDTPFFISYTNSTDIERNRNYFRFLRYLGYDRSDEDLWDDLKALSVSFLNRPFHRMPGQERFVNEVFRLEL